MSGDPFEAALAQAAGSAVGAAPAPVPRAPLTVRTNNPGAVTDGPFARRQPGYVGAEPAPDGMAFAKFDTPENGAAAQTSLLQNNYWGKGLNTVNSIIDKYTGGPNAPGNNAASIANYKAHVAQRLGVGPDDPLPSSVAPQFAQAQQGFESGRVEGAAPSQVGTPTPDPNDPFEHALIGATSAGDGGLPAPVSQAVPDPNGDNNSNPGGNRPVLRPDPDQLGAGAFAGVPGGGGGEENSGNTASGGVAPASGVVGAPGLADTPFVNGLTLHDLQDMGAGAVRGAHDVGSSITRGLNWVSDKTGLDSILPNNSPADWQERNEAAIAGLAHDPNSNAFSAGEMGGNLLATAPVMAMGAPEAGLARYLALAGQGGAVGALASAGRNVGWNTAMGAGLGGVGGAAFDALAPLALKAAGKVMPSKLAQALMRGSDDAATAAPVAAPEAAAAADLPPLRPGSQIRTGADLPPLNLVDMPPGTKPPAEGIYANAPGEKPILHVNIDGASDAPTTIPPEALGSRGARTGIEAHDQMPPDVAATFQKLTQEGVAPAEALREADVIAAGGSPTAGDITRNPSVMRMEKEGAKLDTPEGQALSIQQAQNNAALHDTAQAIVDGYGGASAPGDAMQATAESLAKAADAARAGVTKAYADAEAANGAARVRPDLLREVLHDPMNLAATSQAGATFLSGMQKRLALLSDDGRVGLTPEALESLRKTANAAYEPIGGGELNSLVGKVKGAIDEGFDQLGDAGPAYAKARAKHRAYMQAYENPKGISDLIARDNEGNFLNADKWRAAESLIGKTNDAPFVQITKQLKANGDTATLNKLKATIVQDAYEKATGRNAGTAADQVGNSLFQGSQFHNRLNQIGQTKLGAAFDPEEIARLASLGRAGVAVNEAVPGTVNTSNTASAYFNAQKRMAGKEKSGFAKAVGGALHTAVPIIGAAAHGWEGAGAGAALDALRTGVGTHVEMKAQMKAAEKLAEALKTTASPGATRAAEQAAAQRAADTLRRRNLAKAISERGAPVAASAQERR